MSWVRFSPRKPLLVLDKIFPEGLHIPDYFQERTSSICPP